MELAESFSATVQLVSRGIPHEGAARPMRGRSLGFFTFGGHFDPQSEKTLDLWPRQARSAEVRPRLYRELNG
jgi:hypothetical protein